MLIKVIKNIREKFKEIRNLYSADLPLREEYYKDIEILQDSYNFFKAHSSERSISSEEERETISFFEFLYQLGDFLTPLNFKDLLFLLKNKENQLKFSFLLLDCAYFFEDFKLFENLIDFLEKNLEFLKEDDKNKLSLKKTLLNLLKGDFKIFENSIEKAISSGIKLEEFTKEQLINQLKISPLELKEEIKNYLGIQEKSENPSLEDLIKKYEKKIVEGNLLQEKFLRNLLEKNLKEKRLDLEKLNKLTELLSRIDTYFLNNHSEQVRDLTLKICEAGKNLWNRELDINKIERGSYFHDLGKLSLPWVLMDKRLPLNEKEREKFKVHSPFTFEILKNSGLEEEAIFALDHHKYINGKGYPEDNIKPSFEGNIICLAESFIGAVNLSSPAKVRQKDELFIELKQLRGIYFYEEIVDALLLLV